MISSEKGKGTISGSVAEILADFSTIVKYVFEAFKEVMEGKDAKRFLDEAYNDGFKTEEELEAMLEREKKKLRLMKELAEMLEEDKENGRTEE